MELLTLVISLTLITITAVICIREMYINYYNPIPKFNDSEKDLSKIPFIKTRIIE